MEERHFRITIVTLSLLAILLSIVVFGELTKPVWEDTPQWEPATAIMQGFYAEEDHSLDILFLGSSHVFCGVSPLAIYEQTHLKSYDLASGMQRSWMSYHYLIEALKTQHPSVVVLETSMLMTDSQNEEGRNRMAIDYMAPSANKWAAAKASLNEEAGESMLSYYLPLFRFHDRILELETADFTLPFRDKHNFLHGYRFEYMDTTMAVSPLTYDSTSATPAILWEENSKALEYLHKIISLCQQENIRLVLLTTPVADGWSAEEAAAMHAFASDNGLLYADFGGASHPLGLDGHLHFYDATHLNTQGAHIFSLQLGQWLMDNCFGGNPGTPTSRWDEDLLLLHSRRSA